MSARFSPFRLDTYFMHFVSNSAWPNGLQRKPEAYLCEGPFPLYTRVKYLDGPSGAPAAIGCRSEYRIAPCPHDPPDGLTERNDVCCLQCVQDRTIMNTPRTAHD